MDMELQILGDPYPSTSKTGKYVKKINVLCFCGKTFASPWSNIKRGFTKSCGCLKKSRRTVDGKYNNGRLTHGMSKTSIFRVWTSMRQRCFDVGCPAYSYYGGRGITICDEWYNDSRAFLKWAISSGYVKGLHLDRIDPDGNYCPENCRWVTAKENQRNKRYKLLVKCGEIERPLFEWAELSKIPYRQLYVNIFIHNMKPEDALSGKKYERKVVPIDFEYAKSIKDKLTISGRKQRWLVQQMRDRGLEMNDYKLSEKINGHSNFTDPERKVLKKIKF
jgi:hypothetical protein